MEAILTHQSASKGGNDIMVIDDVISNYCGSTEQNTALDLVNGKEKKRNHSLLKLLVPNCSKNLSIKVGNKSKNVYVVSHFLSKDEGGRLIVFNFWMRGIHKPVEIRKKIEKYAKLAKMQLNPADAIAIEVSLSLMPKVRVGCIILGLLIALIAIKTIFKF